MAVAIHVNNSPISARIAGFTMDAAMNERSTARFTTESRQTVGHSVAIFNHSGVRIFGGSIDECSEIANGATVSFESLCVSWEARADRRVFGPRVFGQMFAADSASDVITSNGHGLIANQKVRLRTTGTLPGGLSTGTTYYARDIATNTFKLAASSGGAAIDITSAGTGTHTFLVLSKDIVTEIIAAMGGDAIGTGTLADGDFVRMVFDYTTCTAALDAVASANNYVWRIEPDGDLTFHPRTTYAAPFSITDTSSQVQLEALSYRQTRQDLRNAEYRRIAFEATDAESETFSGNGSQTRFWLAKRAIRIESISVDGEAVSIGTDGVDTGQAAYWVPGEYSIRFDPAPATGSNNIAIRYRELGADFIYRDDPTRISARATIEGNSGIYASIVDDSANADGNLAITLADKDIATFGDITGELTYYTTTDGVLPGQLQTVTLSRFALSSVPFLIDRVSAELVNPTKIRHAVSAVTGTRLRTLVDLINSLGGGGGGGAIASSGGGAAAAGILNKEVTLSASTTNITAPATATEGKLLIVAIATDATPGRQITWSTDFATGTPVEFDNSASATTIMIFAGRADGKWHIASQR